MSVKPYVIPFADYSESYVFPSETGEACRVRELIANRLRQHEYDENEVLDIVQAVEEALVNAIKHGNKCDCRKRLRVAFGIGDECFQVCIEDEGLGFDLSSVPDPIAPDHIEMPCGRGLLMMKHFMSEVHHVNPGNAVVMIKRRCG